MSAYKLLKAGVKRAADGACIPPDAGNMDWHQYQVWLGQGNTPDPQDLDPTPIDYSDSNNLDKTLKALALCIAQVGGLTPQQIRTMFKNKFDSLP